MTKIKRFPKLMYLILLVNVFDIVIHVVSGQPEALRITSNIFVIVSGILLAIQPRYQLLFAVSLSLYIILNTVFIVLNGIGGLGVVLIATTLLSGVFILRKK